MSNEIEQEIRAIQQYERGIEKGQAGELALGVESNANAGLGLASTSVAPDARADYQAAAETMARVRSGEERTVPLEEVEAKLVKLTRIDEEIEAAPGWQPIDTAPKDGTRIILGCVGGDSAEGYWMGDPLRNYYGLTGWYEAGDDVLTTGPLDPTHWMPLPGGPKE